MNEDRLIDAIDFAADTGAPLPSEAMAAVLGYGHRRGRALMVEDVCAPKCAVRGLVRALEGLADAMEAVVRRSM